jgi:uncharacterized protein
VQLRARLRETMMFQRVALLGIRAYQLYLSPYKGFCCAYKKYTGRGSCSQLGYRAIRKYGLIGGVEVLNQRLSLCGVVNRRNSQPIRRKHRSQRGDCIPSCDFGCDSPDLKCFDILEPV